ncbi:unnamed protein product [Pleuronectes platessa]|uniref:Uncharacterized protein n=1 Tax=Pleuronectes platessa TaxID=8262 RepID=A0A9N7U4V6_PLEPL|nr:unnamed protein product [Pleuronectes platessa]
MFPEQPRASGWDLSLGVMTSENFPPRSLKALLLLPVTCDPDTKEEEEGARSRERRELFNNLLKILSLSSHFFFYGSNIKCSLRINLHQQQIEADQKDSDYA